MISLTGARIGSMPTALDMTNADTWLPTRPPKADMKATAKPLLCFYGKVIENRCNVDVHMESSTHPWAQAEP